MEWANESAIGNDLLDFASFQSVYAYRISWELQLQYQFPSNSRSYSIFA